LACLYADENFPFPAVEALRRLGHDVLTAREAGQAGSGVAVHRPGLKVADEATIPAS
jgi:hypothetical protein